MSHETVKNLCPVVKRSFHDADVSAAGIAFRDGGINAAIFTSERARCQHRYIKLYLDCSRRLSLGHFYDAGRDLESAVISFTS